jgi:hypothetical protein
VKREPKRPTVPSTKDFLDHLRWLQEQNVAANAFASMPNAKVKQFVPPISTQMNTIDK